MDCEYKRIDAYKPKQRSDDPEREQGDAEKLDRRAAVAKLGKRLVYVVPIVQVLTAQRAFASGPSGS